MMRASKKIIQGFIMGERQAPSPNAASPQAAYADRQCSLAKDHRWPPHGWPMFACITQNSGTAASSERGISDNSFLKYDLTIADDGLYNLEIMEGFVGKNGTSLKPAIGIRFTAKEDWLDENPQNSVTDIHIKGQNLIPEKGAVLRVILAITYLVSRIDRGVAPNLKKVLKIYRLA